MNKLKYFLTATLLLCYVFISANNSSPTYSVRATKYYPNHNCGIVTADGSRININRVNNHSDRWVALSRDMFGYGFKMGDRICVTSDNKRLNGVWIVKDKMGPRKTRSIDFLMTPQNSKNFENPCTVKIRKI